MDNSTAPFYFNFTMFLVIGHFRYPVFVFCLLLYAFIFSANLVIILVIVREQVLHEPMHVFIACLCVNSIYVSAGFFPRFLMDILSDTHLISRPACFTQIYIISTYAANELTILGIMAYDRYVAVCHPLHYHRKMTVKVVVALVTLAWFCPALYLTLSINTTARLPLCSNNMHKIYCASWNIVKLSCVTTAVNNVAAMLGAVAIAFVPFAFIFYTYLRILVACWKTPSRIRGKVMQSCLPHVITFSIYSVTSFSDTALNRQNLDEVNPVVAIVLSVEFIIIPPLLNPLVYGLKLPEIRRHIFTLLRVKTNVKKNSSKICPESTS